MREAVKISGVYNRRQSKDTPQPTIGQQEYIKQKQREIDRYNARHGTRLSYGKFVALEYMGKI